MNKIQEGRTMNSRQAFDSYLRTCAGSRHTAILLATCLLTSAPVGAATIDWLGATSDWASPANWGTGSGPVPGAADLARFQSSAGKTQPTLTAEHSVSGLVFNTSSWTIDGAPNLLHIGAGGISSGSSATHTLNCDVRVDADQTWYASPGAATLNIYGVVSGTGRVSITGNKVNITNNNVNFSGGVTLNGYDATGGGLYTPHLNALGTNQFKIYKGWFSGQTIAPTEIWGDLACTQWVATDFYGPVELKNLVSAYWSSQNIRFFGPVSGPGGMRLYCGAASSLSGNNSFVGPFIPYYASGIVTLSGTNKLSRELINLDGALNVNAAGNSFGKGVKLYEGTLNVAATASLGTAGVVRVYGGRLVVNGASNFGATQPVVIDSTFGARGRLSMKANVAPPAITSASSGVLAIDITGYNSLSSLAGMGTLFLGRTTTDTGCSFTGETLTAGDGGVYRLGGGRTGYSLTFNKPSAGALLTGNNRLEIGRNGGGDHDAGEIILADANDFIGSITVNRGSTLTGYAQAAAVGTPFGSDSNTIALNGGTIALGLGGATTARQPLTNDAVTINGSGQFVLAGSSSAPVTWKFKSLTLDTNWNSGVAITANSLGRYEKLLVQDNPPVAIPGVPGILDVHFRSDILNFLKYDPVTGFSNYTAEVAIGSAGSDDIAAMSGAFTQSLTRTVYALSIRGGSGYTMSDGGSGKVVINSGGLSCPDTQNGKISINVPVQFGPDSSNVEAVVYAFANPNAGYWTTMTRDIVGSGGLTKFGPGRLELVPAGNVGKQHADLSGRLALLGGSLRSVSTGVTAVADQRFPYVTEILMNGGGLHVNSGTTLNMPLKIGPNGGSLSLHTSAANAMDVNGNVSGEGLLRLDGYPNLNWNGTANTYSGGTYINRSAGTLTVAANSSLGAGDVRHVAGTVVLLGAANIASTSRVFQAGSTLEFQYVGTSEIGSLAGYGGVINLGPAAGSATSTLKLGGNHDSTAYYGSIRNKDTTNKRGGALEKAGNGTLALWGANTYTGATTVAAGTLLVNWTLTGAGGLPVTCTSGATLGGIGRIERPVTINDSGTLAPGDEDVGTLTVSNLYLAASSITAIEINSVTNDKVVVIGDLTLGGDLAINPLPDAVIGTHELMTYTGAYATSGTPTVSAPPGFKGTLTVDTTNKRVLLGLTNSSGGTILIFR
jgi:fibronectin-binding autotransporter adhesin